MRNIRMTKEIINYKIPAKIVMVFAFILISALAQGQMTVIRGKVTDAETAEPIAFANVFFKGTTVGSTTDFDGKFSISTQNPGDSLTVMVVGYISRAKTVKKGKSQTINYQLKPTTFELGEVTIEAGENPAHPIIRKARKRKSFYNQERLDAYQYKSYVKVDVSIDKISEKFKNSRAMKPFKPIFDSLDKAAGADGKAVIPFFISENMVDVYYLKDPKREKQVVHANKLTGLLLDNTQIIERFLAQAFQDYNFNDNWIRIFDRNFISPLSNGGFGYYEYYIMDTVLIDNDSCYKIKVKPKRPQDLAFYGNIWIADSSYALRRLDLEIGKTANLNFIERYKLQQDYEMVGDSAYMPVRSRILVDMEELSDNSVGLIGKFYVSNKDYVINDKHDLKFYQKNVVIDPNSRNKSEVYWDTTRHKMINDVAQVEQSYAVIDSMRQSPQISRVRKIIRTVWDGYYTVGPVQFGHWFTLFGYNEVEGFRIQPTAQTTVDFSKKWILKGYTAYGFKDTKLKYMGQVEYFLDRDRWRKVGVQMRYDMDRLGIDRDFLESHVFLNFLFMVSNQFGYLQRMSLSREYRAWYETDHWRGWNSKIILKHTHFNPQGGYVFAYYGDDGNTYSTYRNSSITLMTSYSSKRVWLVEDNWRMGMGVFKAPVWTVKLTMGFKGIFGSDFTYQKISLNVRRKWQIGTLGRLDYIIAGTKVFGVVPYPEANIPQGNEPPIASERSYNMMNFFEFVTDESVEGIFLHHFNGLLLNRIPLMKRLKLRSIVGFNFVWGTYNKKNYIRTEDNPDGLMPAIYEGRPLTQFKILEWEKPYMEVSYGVENIFKVFRIQAMHRLSYLEGGMKDFAVKASFTISL